MNHNLTIIKNAALENRLAHLLIFHGSGGLERQKAFRELALVLNCKGDNSPCRQCSACKKILTGNHPDVHVVEPQKTSIGIEQIALLQQKLYRKPFEGKYRVCLIDEADKLTIAAANALLKVAEEPPEATIIVFSTSNAEGIIATLRSRAQIVYLPPPKQEEWEIGTRDLYDLSGGDPDLARSIEQIGVEKLTEWLQLYLKIIETGDFLQSFNLFPLEKEESIVFLKALTVKIKQLVLSGELTADYLAELRKTMAVIRRQVNHRLAIEVLMLKHIQLGGIKIG
ncbi:MAG: DNA polymerase III subunit delta' [Peptococcaceae bacterium]|jgi:DNA polymerase-3 subunit delta'|nr:DNA polymerase III subunit delta' [Peptococcaceae bacterium]